MSSPEESANFRNQTHDFPIAIRSGTRDQLTLCFPNGPPSLGEIQQCDFLARPEIEATHDAGLTRPMVEGGKKIARGLFDRLKIPDLRSGRHLEVSSGHRGGPEGWPEVGFMLPLPIEVEWTKQHQRRPARSRETGGSNTERRF